KTKPKTHPENETRPDSPSPSSPPDPPEPEEPEPPEEPADPTERPPRSKDPRTQMTTLTARPMRPKGMPKGWSRSRTVQVPAKAAPTNMPQNSGPEARRRQ